MSAKKDDRRKADKKDKKMKIRLVDCLLPPGHPHAGAK